MSSTAIDKAMEYICSEWRQGKSLKEVSEMFGVDAGNLARAFRNLHGTTVKRYTDNNRRLYFLKILSSNSKRGYEIGKELGFISDRAFYRWVNRVFDLSFRDLRVKLTRKRNKK